MPMTEREVQSFLAQFDQAREDFKTWPKWMQDAAVERAASFPMPPKDGVPGAEEPSNEELEALWQEHGGHPADFAADVLERWGGWPPGVLGQGGTAGVNPSHGSQA